MPMLNSFTVTPNPSKRCDGCGMIVGKDSPIHTGIIVKDGPLTGFFHSHQCYERKWNEVNPDTELREGGEM